MEKPSFKAALLASVFMGLAAPSASAQDAAQPASTAPAAQQYTVYFSFDSSDLTAAAKEVVASAAQSATQGKEIQVDVTGHSDRAGDAGYNMDLSALRAETVKGELIHRGVPDTTIHIAWKGENEPALATADGVREPLNRRAVIMVAGAPVATSEASATSETSETAATGGAESNIADQFSATFAFTTNYIFRGGSQTQNDPAFQGSFDWSHPSGLYAGVWSSNIDFSDAPDDDANVEVDFYGGYGGSINQFSYGIGAIYYAYPGANDAGAEYDYWELTGSAGYDFGVASLTGSIYWSPEFFGETGDAIYYNAAVSIPLTFITFLPNAPTLDGSVGYQTWTSDTKGLDDYLDWSFGLTVPVWGFDLGFTYTDTNIDYMGLAPAYSEELSDAKFIFSISRATGEDTADAGGGDDIADQFSATFGFTTNYIFRGGSQTQNDPAFQGSFDWSHPSGLYAGVWASNIDFGDMPDDDANIEVDFYGGYGSSINQFSYGLGAIYYAYPGANDAGAEYDYVEIMGTAGYDFGVASLTGSIYWSPEFFAETGDAIYYNAAVSIPLTFINFLPDAPTLDGSVGYQTWTSDTVGLDDYVDWSIGVGVPVLGFDLGFTYTDTNIDYNAPNFAYSEELSDAKFIFSISRTF